MAIPKHNEIRIPALEFLIINGKTKLREFVQPLADHFNLTDEEVNENGHPHILPVRV